MQAVRKLDLGRTAFSKLPDPNAQAPVVKKDYSQDERKSMAKEGTAMPDGSYPIADGADLEHAISLSGMGSEHPQRPHGYH